MDKLLSNRIQNVPESFIRKILKVSIQSDIISFAGGHPCADLFPVEAIEKASTKVLQNNGKQALQYASTEGDSWLRHWIAQRYQQKQGVSVSPDNILITNGSQQAFDLLGKVLLNDGDSIAMENPGYLGAIQSFSLYQPQMCPVALHQDGLDIEQLRHVLAEYNPKLVYTVPNFQNPTGITYSEENRVAVAALVSGTDSLLIQDDPYGELRFSGESKSNFHTLLSEQTILLGTFSKVIVPSFRLGWMVVPDWLMKPLVIAKQAADLHTNYFSQQVIAQYLKDNSLDEHIEKIRLFYSQQKQTMLKAIQAYLPDTVKVTESEGGMFIWLTLPENMSAMKLFDLALKKGVAFVPGEPFTLEGLTDISTKTSTGKPQNTLRLSFVTADSEGINEGIMRLGDCIKSYE